MFRVKIVLLTMLLAGSVLIGLGRYSLSVMNKVGVERLDREILALGGSQLHAAAPPGHWLNFDRSLRFIYGEDRAKRLAVRISIAGREVIYQSGHWPAGISESAFPEFDQQLEELPSVAVQEERPAPWFDPGGPGGRGIRRVPPGMRDEGFAAAPFPGAGVGRELRTSPVRIKKPFFRTVRASSGPWRIGIMGNQYMTILLGLNMEDLYQDASRYEKAFWSIIPVALLLLAAGGWIIADRALRPVAVMTRTAESISARSLDQRIPATAADRELSRLAAVINDMLDRLQKSLQQAMRFSADAAHELQTPLTVLQGELDCALQQAPVGSDEQRRYGALLGETRRLKTIVQKLLLLARADAGKLRLSPEPVDLSAMIAAAVEDAGVLAPQLRIDGQIASPVTVKADPVLLGQVVRNLTSNAVKYTGDRGVVRFRLSTDGSEALFTISNTGEPIPAHDRDRIFDRFYRVDRSRGGPVRGAGLGLSLAREIAHAHGGELRLEPWADGFVSFSLSLPCTSS